MTRRDRLWFGAAALFTIGNVAGALWAASLGEQMHCAIHVALAFSGTVWAWWISTNARRRAPASPMPADARLEQLQQAVDAVALEVERIGEAQRFRDKLHAEKIERRD